MKVLFLIGSLNQGGAEYQILALSNLFKDKGHEIEVLALTNYTFYLPYVEQKGIPYRYLSNTHSKLTRIYRTIKRIRDFKTGIVIAYTRVVSIVAIIAKILSFRSFRVLVSERTSLIIPVYDAYYFNLMRLANVITTNSLSKCRYLNHQFPFLKSKTHFMPNLVDLHKYSSIITRDKNYVQISFVGRISPEKNILTLIEAFSILCMEFNDIVLKIYGESHNPKYFEKLAAMVSSNRALLGRIELCGKTEAIENVYSQTNLLCLISDYEGFSNVISEALCCGIPIIASDIEENRYLVEDQVNGFIVNHKDVKDVARGIRQFLNLSMAEVNKMKVDNRMRAEKLFDADKLYNDYLRLLKGTN